MTETSKPITMDQYDRFTLPLGKAISIIELAIEDMSANAANGAIAAQDLIREAQQIVRDWVGNDTAENPDADFMIEGESVGDLQSASLDVIREVVKELEDALICPRMLLKAVDKRDKAA